MTTHEIAPPASTTRRRVLVGVAAFATLPTNTACALSSPAIEPAAAKLIAAATAQIGVTTLYDPSYQRLVFPGGDVPPDRGVCTDVIVRAYRTAFGFDLQQKLNADMRASRAAYPNRWGLAGTDASIDHRRVPNLQAFFARQNATRPRALSSGEWLPGDLVTQMVASKLPHIGIVSGTLNAANAHPLVIHNIGHGTVLEDILEAYPVTGRYRFLPAG